MNWQVGKKYTKDEEKIAEGGQRSFIKGIGVIGK
jgi:hypothetical protein